MIRPTLCLALLALAACSEPSGTAQSEADFAARVGTGKASASAVQTGVPAASKAIKGPPPPGADVLALEKLGDVGGVNLGPRAGGCTFSSAGTEMLIAAGPADRAIPGKGLVRIGGRLIELDTPPGGIDAIKAGTSFRGEGFSITVRPTAPGKATLTIADGKGRARAIAGDYVCA